MGVPERYGGQVSWHFATHETKCHSAKSMGQIASMRHHKSPTMGISQ